MNARPEFCPTCGSSDPALHPASQHGGEVERCRDAFHGDAAELDALARLDRPALATCVRTDLARLNATLAAAALKGMRIDIDLFDHVHGPSRGRAPVLSCEIWEKVQG